jgi:transposase
MPEIVLPTEELVRLRAAHRRARKKRDADRIKAVVLLASGWSVAEVAQALLLDEGTVRNYLQRYQQGGLPALLKEHYKGSQARLSAEALAELEAHLERELYGSVKEIVAYVAQRFGVRYSERGMTELLHRLGFTYKKAKVVPGKADAEAQQAFVEQYEKLKEEKGKDDPIYFMDGTHPHHNPMPAYGWIKKGEDQEVPSNTGRRRVNINGAINIETMSATVRFDPSINAHSTVSLLRALESKHPTAQCIYVICDNAGYYRSRDVQAYLKDSKVELVFLPPYSPNLNLIERLWKYFKKQILYNRYYPTFDEFKAACVDFFRNTRKHRKQLRTLLRERFNIIAAPAA